MKRLLLGFALLAVAWAASADDIALYKVELIVFENLDPGAIQAENWPDNPGTPPLDNAVELSAVTAAPAPLADATAVTQPLPPTATMPPPAAQGAATPSPPPITAWRWLNDSELSLNPQVQKLNDSRRYKTIVHVGWIQPLDSTDQGKAVHIYDGMELKHADAVSQTQVSVIPLNQDGDAPQQTPPAAPVPEAATPPPQATPAPATAEDNADQTPQNAAQSPGDNAAPPPAAETPHILDGTFTLRRGHFLHVDVDLGYTKTVNVEGPPPGADAAPVAPQTTSIYVRMTQSRRIRNDELNYLDHPLFGVLFVVSPYQTEGPDTSTDE
jgi:Peptidoglycan-binding protein, CsiV